MRQTTLHSCQKWDATNPKAVEITNLIGKWIASSLLPYSTVECPHFREMMNVAQPRYNVPSRFSFSRFVIPKLATDIKQKVVKELNMDNCEALCFTTDLWTSIANSSYISLTVHFITDDFLMKTYVLGSRYFPENHTAVCISQKCTEILNEYFEVKNCSAKTFCVTDNAVNMISAMRLLDFELLTCFAHTIQLAIKDAKDATDGFNIIMKKARAIVGHYKHSAKATKRLRKSSQINDEKFLELIQDCVTRWNSEYLMLERLLHHRIIISIDLTNHVPHLDNLSVNNWKMVSGYVKTLKPLYDATVEVSAELHLWLCLL